MIHVLLGSVMEPLLVVKLPDNGRSNRPKHVVGNNECTMCMVLCRSESEDRY
jgi:hypothetical protein